MIASVRIPPRMIPMQGVQPMAKIAPSPNEASQPPRWLTRREPSRSPTPSDEPPSDIVPVAVASDEDAPASSGRQVRSSAEIRMMPGQAEPHDHEHEAADDAQRREVVVERARREGRGDARGA